MLLHSHQILVMSEQFAYDQVLLSQLKRSLTYDDMFSKLMSSFALPLSRLQFPWHKLV